MSAEVWWLLMSAGVAALIVVAFIIERQRR